MSGRTEGVRGILHTRRNTMNFGLTEEQDMIVNTVRSFVETELYPSRIRSRNRVSCRRNGQEIAQKVKDLGFFGCNMPKMSAAPALII